MLQAVHTCWVLCCVHLLAGCALGAVVCCHCVMRAVLCRDLLAEGATAIVYAATDKQTGRQVALKVGVGR
jgi:hypothetical protein